VNSRTGIPASTRSCSIERGEIAVSASASPDSTIARSSSWYGSLSASVMVIRLFFATSP
jgi:hypothetical protein